MEVKVTFTYLNKIIQVLCKQEDKMDKMYRGFTNKLNDGSDITHYIYYYNGNKLGHESTIEENKYIAHKKEIIISVQKKLRFIKCPECKCNDCIIDLNNYLASFYGCKYNHKYATVYDNYITIQKVDSSEIRCNAPNCQHTQQNYISYFYKCLACTKLLKRSIYFCQEHLIHKNHRKDLEVIEYEKKIIIVKNILKTSLNIALHINKIYANYV